ncbi:MAG: bacillithiol system redox-active protein YtxJ [Bacteroidetes bacterium]|nr:bacillithiol system redox-active protein YtxJ [Bacteroidota bacterium]HET6243094.1 bacillithiol system redox-active protein YtxJ [Bacteroidia bacterium]
MGFFDRITNENTNNSNETNKITWIEIKSIENLDELVERAKSQPVAIFKHSTRCIISKMVLKQFEKDFNLKFGQMDMYILDLIAYRSVSNKIATIFNLRHESPQIIVIIGGKVVFHASHNDINAQILNELVG